MPRDLRLRSSRSTIAGRRARTPLPPALVRAPAVRARCREADLNTLPCARARHRQFSGRRQGLARDLGSAPSARVSGGGRPRGRRAWR